MTIMQLETTPKEEIMAIMQAVDILMPELIEMYLDDGPHLLQEVYQAIEAQDAIALKNSAHTLKGSSDSMGLKTLAAHCQNVENCAKSGDFSTAQALMPQLEAEFNQVISLFESIV